MLDQLHEVRQALVTDLIGYAEDFANCADAGTMGDLQKAADKLLTFDAEVCALVDKARTYTFASVAA